MVSIVTIASLIYLMVLAVTVIEAYALIPQWVLYVQAIGALVVIINFLLFFRFRNVAVAATVLLLCIFSIHMANVHFAGGIDTPHYAWILVIPILAGATMGWKGQTFFAVITVLGTIYYAIFPVELTISPYAEDASYVLVTRALSLIVFSLIMISYYFTLNEKIFQLKTALNQVSFESNLFQGVFDSKAQGILLAEADNKILRANNKAHEIFHFQQGELINASIYELCKPDLAKVGQAIPSELRVTTKSDEILWIEMTMLNIEGQQNNQYKLLTIEDITARKNHESELDYLAHYDYLTKLPNRLIIQDRLTEIIASDRHERKHFAVVFIDLDKFKNINDVKGHEIGDKILIEVGIRLKKAIRTQDVIARFGGDEFVVLLNDFKRSEKLAKLLEELQTAIIEPMKIQGKEYFINSTFGIAMYPEDGKTPGDLLRKADTAMYQAKRTKRGSYEFFSTQHDEIIKRSNLLSNKLNYAIDKKELTVLYQPIYNAKDKICGAEALVRWDHAELGSIYPEEFIPISEDNGLIIPIGSWVLDCACKALSEWHDLGFDDFKMAVNISYRQIKNDDLIHEVKRMLAQHDVPGKHLGLELTESIFVDDATLVQDYIEKFSEIDVEMAIDDFGVGYSSLNYLKKAAFTSLKIDRSFIKDIDSSASARNLCNAIVSMAKSLELSTTAEGIENADHLKILKSLGVDKYQGFYMSKPVTFNEFDSLLKAQRILN